MDGLLFLSALIAIAFVVIWTVIQDSRGESDAAPSGDHNAGAHAKSRSAREIHRVR